MVSEPRKPRAPHRRPGGKAKHDHSPLGILAGAWVGTCIQGSGNNPVYALFLPDGTFRAMIPRTFPGPLPGDPPVASWVQVAGSLKLEGGTLSGSGKLYNPPLLANRALPLRTDANFHGKPGELVLSLAVRNAGGPEMGDLDLELAPLAGNQAAQPLCALAGIYRAEPADASSMMMFVFALPAMPANATVAKFGGVDAVARTSGGLVRALAAGSSTAFSHSSRLHFTVPPPAIFNGAGPFDYGGLGFAVPGAGSDTHDLVIMANTGPVGFAGVFTANPVRGPLLDPLGEPKPAVEVAGMWSADAGDGCRTDLELAPDGTFRLTAANHSPFPRAQGRLWIRNGMVLGGATAWTSDSGDAGVPAGIQGTHRPDTLMLVIHTDPFSWRLEFTPIPAHSSESARARVEGVWLDS